MELDTFGMSHVTVTVNIRVNQNLKCEYMSRRLIGETVHSKKQRTPNGIQNMERYWVTQRRNPSTPK